MKTAITPLYFEIKEDFMLRRRVGLLTKKEYESRMYYHICTSIPGYNRIVKTRYGVRYRIHHSSIIDYMCNEFGWDTHLLRREILMDSNKMDACRRRMED